MNIVLKTCLAALLLCNALTAAAIPAWPGLKKVKLADGTEVMCRQVGDEHGHWFVTTDGAALDRNERGEWMWLSNDEVETRKQQMQASREALALKHQAAQQGRKNANSDEQMGRITDFPTEGEVRGLFILVDFEDVKFQPENDSLAFTRQLNVEGYDENGATGSARDYFISQSYGKFTPRFDVIGPIHLPHEERYYGANLRDNDIRPSEMVTDACTLAHDSLGVDFSVYDFDENGVVDFVFILYAGYGENYGASSYTVWPHMSHLKGLTDLTLNGKTFDLYACSCELFGSSGTRLDGIGAFCHEFGHVLGLPDFYDTSGARGVQMGEWDIMDQGSYNNYSRTPPSYTGFERYSLGWLDMVDLTEPADSIVLPEINESGVCYRIPVRTGNDNEFFTIENHQKQGWDAFHPGRGMMIIHIDYLQSLWRFNGVNSGTHPLYDLVEADGTQGAPFSTDLYPTASNNMFTDYSTPNSLAWDKTPTERGVDHITQNEDGNISFRFMRDRLLTPVVHEATQLTDSSFVAVWESAEGAIGYRIDVYEELPDSLNPVLLDEDFSGCEDGNYPMAGSSDISDELDEHMQTQGWTGNRCFSAGGYIRVGAYGQNGTLQTPTLSNRESQPLTLLYTASSYPGKTVNYTVSLLDAATGTALCDTTLKADRNMVTHVLNFENAPQQAAFSFTTNRERLYLDEVRLVTGSCDSLTTRNLGPASWSIDSIAPILDSNGKQEELQQYTVAGLAAQRSYHYQITALDPEALRSSPTSAMQTVTTLPADESALVQIEADNIGVTGKTSSQTFNLMGIRVRVPSRGLYIRNGKKVLIR